MTTGQLLGIFGLKFYPLDLRKQHTWNEAQKKEIVRLENLIYRIVGSTFPLWRRISIISSSAVPRRFNMSREICSAGGYLFSNEINAQAYKENFPFIFEWMNEGKLTKGFESQRTRYKSSWWRRDKPCSSLIRQLISNAFKSRKGIWASVNDRMYSNMTRIANSPKSDEVKNQNSQKGWFFVEKNNNKKMSKNPK